MSLAVPFHDRARINSLHHAAHTLNMHLNLKREVSSEVKDISRQILALSTRLYVMAHATEEKVAA